MREEYFKWSQESEEMLRVLVIKATLSWAQIAGTINASYGGKLKGNACRSKHERLMLADMGKERRTRKEGEPLLRRPPAQIRGEIMQEIVKQGFPYGKLFNVPYKATEEQIEAARLGHWFGLVDFMAELEGWSDEEITITKAGEMPKWYLNNWSVPMWIWRP